MLAGYEVLLAADGEQGLLQAQTSVPDALVLDLGLPHIDGLYVCRQLRQTGNRTPILMLTARDGIEDRVAGLEAGADDYLVKPYDVRELRARLRAIMRRHIDGADGRSLRFAELTLDADAHAAQIGDRSVELTRTEYQLLELFMLNPRRVLPNDLIYDRVWGYDFKLSGNSLRVYIGYLRRKLEAGGAPRLIRPCTASGTCCASPSGRDPRFGLRVAFAAVGRILVTGAAGYVGSSLVNSLVDNGVAVRGLVRRPAPWVRGEVRVCDIIEDTQRSTLASALADVDVVVHLAGINEWRTAQDPAWPLRRVCLRPSASRRRAAPHPSSG